MSSSDGVRRYGFQPGKSGNPHGRPKGAVNKRNKKLAEAIALEGITPLDYMLRLLRDPASSPKDRQWAAAQAAPYIHKRMPIGIERPPTGGALLSTEKLRSLPTDELFLLLNIIDKLGISAEINPTQDITQLAVLDDGSEGSN